MRPIDLTDFAEKFAANDDPWRTYSDRDEAVKRTAILHALGPGPLGRVLELGSGNGSNSRAIAARALRLDATEGTAEGTILTADAIAGRRRARAIQLALPARLPRREYDAIVIAELLYYLPPQAMKSVALRVAQALRSGGRLVLAHHRIDYYDFVQHAETIQQRFLDLTGLSWRTDTMRRKRRWHVIVARLVCQSHPGG
ncbi:SAM-dependent methyltransferase [uncultured Sphingomonas sp.]|uniref:class I SAM-dependent methyltransferase n=1 Tax=uncultured Sphingomonas sp. TaxID=158754 RepID=UPI0025F629B7|nr:SAM-dependent methyltransferase [uncultured Sphingomonas sp.]